MKYLIILPVVVVCLFFGLPYIAAVAPIFSATAVNVSYVAGIATWTLMQAFLSACLALLLGIPGAWFLSGEGGGRFARVFRQVLNALGALPFALPPILVALMFALFFGNSGWLNSALALILHTDEVPLHILYRPSAIILAHAFYNFPLFIRLCGDALKNVRNAYSASAYSLGSKPIGLFFRVCLPLILPAVFSAFLLAFLYSLGSFAIVLVLGGGPAASTLSVEIYRYARITLHFPQAALLALIETVFCISVFLVYNFFSQKSTTQIAGQRNSVKHFTYPFAKKENSFLILYALFILLFVGGPFLTIFVESALKFNPSFPLHSLFAALGRSIVLALLASSFSVILAICAQLDSKWGKEILPPSPCGRGWGRGAYASLNIIMNAPLFSSGIVLGLGFIALYGRTFSRSLIAVALAQAVLALPFAYNSIKEGFRSCPLSLLHAAASLGAGPWKRLLTIQIPLAARTIRSAFAFSALISLGELNMPMMLGLQNFETLPLYIYRAVGSYRYAAAALAGVVLLCAASLTLFTLNMASRKAAKKISWRLGGFA
ncbi:MAG: iron ABC transporter permease [Spirochaetaceae bacterium]|nr:iron ABC transporter permease [Spirochaetaceae bacterium]